jgi:hypothetical protein
MLELDSGKVVLSEVRGTPVTQGSMYAGLKRDLGGRWDKNKRAWRLFPTSLVVTKLVEMYGEEILVDSPPEVVDLYHEDWGFQGFSPEERRIAEAHPSWHRLYEFQKEAVEFMFCNPHMAGLLGLSPGLGKTTVSIVTLDLLEITRALVLAPLTLAKSWGAEIVTWAARTHDTRRAQAGDREPGDAITIANHEVIQEVVARDEDGNVYADEVPVKNKKGEVIGIFNPADARAMKAWIEGGPKVAGPKGKKVWARERIVRLRRDYMNLPWELVIADESILLKNREAVKGDVLMTLRKTWKDAWYWMLSGAPSSKYRDHMFRQLQIMLPSVFTSYWRFAEFFCVVDKDGWGWTIEGDRPEIDVHLYLKDVLFVRSQEEVLPELPKYILRELPLDATPAQRKALDSMFNDWMVEGEEDPDELVTAANWLARFTRLQQITSNMCSLPKPKGGYFKPSSATTDALADLVKQEDVEYPMLVWTWYVETAHEVEKRLQKANKKLRVASVVGPEPTKKKESKLQAFKDAELDVLVLQLGVGKHGHTFTKTRTVFYHDLTTDADALVQSLRRVPRIGLEHRPVLIVPKIEDSAHELLQSNLDEKLPSIGNLTKSELTRVLATVKAEAEGVPSLMRDWAEED